MIETKTRSTTYIEAFTIIELLVVVLVLSILASTIFNSYAISKSKAEVVQAKSDLLNLNHAIISYKLDYNAQPSTPPAPLNIFTTHLEVKNMSMLTTPTTYINVLPVSPWYKNNINPYNFWLASHYEEELIRTKTKIEFKTEPIPDYFYETNIKFHNGKRNWMLWSNGPMGIRTATLYSVSNGLISTGGIFCDDFGLTYTHLANR